MLSLKPEETDWLARHLGHDVRVHRDFYRLPDAALELSKVSKLLVAVEEGTVHKHSGQPLENINLEKYISSNEVITTHSEDEETGIDDVHAVPDISEEISCRNKPNRRFWKLEIKDRAKIYFKEEIVSNTVPRKQKCVKFVEECNLDRKWSDVKNLVRNTFLRSRN